MALKGDDVFESTMTDISGNFRLRGLHPNEKFIIKVNIYFN